MVGGHSSRENRIYLCYLTRRRCGGKQQIYVFSVALVQKWKEQSRLEFEHADFDLHTDNN